MDLGFLSKKLELTPQMKTLGVRALGGVALLGVALYVLVFMGLRQNTRLAAEVEDARGQIRRQQALLPAWASIAAQSHNASLEQLMLPAAEPVPRTRVYLVPEQLSHMARAIGVEPLDVTLNPASMGQDPTSIQVQGMFSGSLDGMRELLMSFSRLPSLARLERVELRAVDGRLELFVQMRIALAS
jgi:hypothetical protein